MSLLNRIALLNPLRVARAAAAVGRLEASSAAMRRDQKAIARQLEEMTKLIQAVQGDLAAVRAKVDDCEVRVEQCAALYAADAVNERRVARLGERLDGDRVRRHAAAAIANVRLEMDPGAHIVIENLLPDEVADEIVRAVPSSLFFPRQNMKRQEIGVPFFFAPEYSRRVWGFFADVLEDTILPAVVERFRPALDEFMRKNWPARGSFAGSGVTLGVSNSRIMLRRPGYRIRPHRDPRWAFLTALFYLQKRDDPHAYGTQFYRLRQEREPAHHSAFWIDDEEVELVKDVPARWNSAVIFLNSTGAHGACIPPDAPAGIERFIFQVQFGPDDATKQALVAELEGAGREAWATPRGGY